MSISRKVARRQERLVTSYPDFGARARIEAKAGALTKPQAPHQLGSTGNRARKRQSRSRRLAAYARWLTARLMCAFGHDRPAVLTVEMPKGHDAYHARIAVRGTTISPATKELQS